MTAPDPRLGEIEGRLSKALDGPWEAADDPMSAGDWMVRMVECGPDEPDDVAAVISHESTAEFIAAAPADVAYLLAELRKAHAALARVEGLHQVAYKAVEKWAEGYRFTGEHCAFDGEHWPCMTFRAAVADATGGGR